MLVTVGLDGLVTSIDSLLELTDRHVQDLVWQLIDHLVDGLGVQSDHFLGVDVEVHLDLVDDLIEACFVHALLLQGCCWLLSRLDHLIGGLAGLMAESRV